MIRKMEKNETFEVMDLWLRTATHSHSFVEPNFWQTHYDYVKKRYIEGKNGYVYMSDGKIAGFTVVDAERNICGLFVDPEYQNRGIGTELINHLKAEYSMLCCDIYAKNRKAFTFSLKLGFVVDGAKRHEGNNEVMYIMKWCA